MSDKGVLVEVLKPISGDLIVDEAVDHLAPIYKAHRHMVKHKKAEEQDPQPVEVITALHRASW